MDVAALPAPVVLTLAAWAVALPLFALALRAAWRDAAAHREAMLIVPAAVFVLCVLWSIRANVGQAFAFHLLGSAGLALAVGWPLALVGGAVVVVLMTLIHGTPLAGAALAWLVQIALPASVATGVLVLVARNLPRQLFVYLFAVGVFGAFAAFAATALAGIALLAVVADVPATTAFEEYLPMLLILGFGEATLTGMLLTLAVAYRPHWVATFDASWLAERETPP